ncbi:CaiB/BaiF CoA transferase family protein [Mycolicibacterium arseniciresistens]|uniref:CoA transferase n=1 Tax=Mycolicibacterium arseniciresistens TaxID=3062257 RepID=A0ABT8UL16_9MYCO|nr:CoA transferase [Mycolicibacterium arseniciresistens]MDO3638497.1 CoA transferase [Mycolicibacterium arseniciresistens]
MSALKGLRIVELAESVAGEYCGKLLADFGADVVKVERPGRGSPTRAMAPLIDGESVVFAYLNTNKRSVVLDRITDAEAVDALVASADAVIDDHDPEWAAEAYRRHPAVVFCSVTAYGRGASPAAQNARSSTVFHSSGWGFHTPSHADPARPPLQAPGRLLTDYEAGLDAAMCVAACLYSRPRCGAGEFVDISQQAVLVSRADCILGRFLSGEIAPENTRDDFDQQGPASFFACADGHVYLYMTSGTHWANLKVLMDHPAWLDDFDEDWLEFSVTAEKVATFHRGFAGWIRDRRRETVAEQAQRAGVPLVPVNDADDLHRSPQYRHRGFFRDVTHPVLGVGRHPTVPYLMSASPADITCAAPALGRHTSEVLGERRTVRPAPVHAPPATERGGPLAGVRVVELTKVWAGPYAGKLLAFLGAEVIKVESAARPEEMRAYGGTDVNHAPYFLSINPEILSVDLDIKTPDGMARLRDLIARSDIVLNNLRPGAMERQGLGYRDLTAVRPDIISVSIKMWGNDGPLGYQTGYAPCFAALAGLASLVGYEGGPPLGASMRYGDSTVGAAAALAAVAALLHRERTGEGQFVDVSAVEVLSSMIGDTLLAHDLTGRVPTPEGNRHPDMAPHGCYPCTGGDWVSIAVAGDAEWSALCAALGAADLAADERYRTTTDRLRHAAALDAELARITSGLDAAPLARRLHDAGVPAAKSATALDVIGDERLWERGLYRIVTDHREGARPVLGPSWRMARDPARIEHGAPDLGEHNDYVFDDILGAQEMR